MQTISKNFIVSGGWHELSDKQLRYSHTVEFSCLISDKESDFHFRKNRVQTIDPGL